MVYRDYQVLFKRLFLSFSFFAIYRIIFYIYNYHYFSPFDVSDTIIAYLYGFRFDLSSMLITNLIFIIGSILPITNFFYRKLLKFIFVLSNMIFLGILVVDLEFFSFLGKKMTFDIFDIGGDIKEQATQLIQNYWFFVLMIFGNGFLINYLYPRRKREIFFVKPIKFYKSIFIGIAIFILTGIGIRGGLQLRSISPKEAFIHHSYELGNLSLNAAYSMVRSIGRKGINKETYFSDDVMAKEAIKRSKSFELKHPFGKQKSNIVILILESFSQEYLNQGYSPFLTSLGKKSLYFDHNLANGRRSIEALPSILTGFPSIIGKPIYQSQYQSNQFFALPKILSDNQYQTAFFHGGKRGTMDFDAYCLSIGFDKYFALEDYPDQSHFDGHWGIFDHYYLEYFANELDKFSVPFFSSLFTLSSHQPYTIPLSFRDQFPKGSLEIHESIGYVDKALENFFEQIKDKPWYNNTLFIITADHTQKLDTVEFNNEIGRYRVPLIFYHPSIDLSQLEKRKTTQQADILSSVIDFLGIDYDKKLLYGSSVFSNLKGSAINFLSGNYFYFKEDYYLRFNENNAELLGIHSQIKEDNHDLLQEYINETKAYIQYTNNGLRGNSLYK